MVNVPARILFVNHTAEIGGPSYSLLMLLHHLKERYQVAVLLPEAGPLCHLLEDEAVPFFIISGLRANSIPRIFQLVRRQGFDLIYGNNPNTCARNALLAAKLARRPFIWHMRGMKWHWTWRKSFFLSWADEVVAVSRACAESLTRYYPLDEINVVYNGVELSSFTDNGSEVRPYLARQLGLSPQAKFVISVSHLLPRKGYEQVTAVMAQLVEQTDNIHLVVAGSLDRDPAYTQKIRAIIQQQKLQEHIHLLGLRQDVPELLSGADIFLHLASQDPHPRAVIEAMAAGLPVVAFAADGVAETVVDGETGYLRPVGDVGGMVEAVLSLLTAPEKAVEMGQAGRRRVQSHFSAASTAAQISQIIERLL